MYERKSSIIRTVFKRNGYAEYRRIYRMGLNYGIVYPDGLDAE